MQAKKPYTVPKLTDHGSVIEQTKGMFGWSYEPWGQIVSEDDVKRPPKEEVAN
jgi:hypothetical protein